MAVDLAISLLAVALGSLGMLLLLFLGFGRTSDTEPENAADLILDPEDPASIADMDGSFISMPEHLKTADSMIAWMTRDLPRLTAESQKSRS